MKLLRPGHPLQLALGLTVWSMWFVIAYGAVSLACDVPAHRGEARLPGVTLTLFAFTLATAAGLAAAAWWCWRGAHGRDPNANFVARTAAWLHGVAAVSTVFVGLPLLLVPACV